LHIAYIYIHACIPAGLLAACFSCLCVRAACSLPEHPSDEIRRCDSHYTLPVMVMLLTSTLVFLLAMMFCILVALILVLRMAMVLAACMMVLEVRSAFLVCFHLPPI
jgi:hypothetical protein